MVELVMVNVVALVLLAALSRGEGISYLEMRERVRDALREANGLDEGPDAAAAVAAPATSSVSSRALQPVMVGVYTLGLVALVIGLAGRADAGVPTAVGADPAVEGLEIRAETPTFRAELNGLGELCAGGAAAAPFRTVPGAGELDVAAPAVRVAAIRLDRLEERLNVRMAEAMARLEAVEAVSEWAVEVRGS